MESSILVCPLLSIKRNMPLLYVYDNNRVTIYMKFGNFLRRESEPYTPARGPVALRPAGGGRVCG